MHRKNNSHITIKRLVRAHTWNTIRELTMLDSRKNNISTHYQLTALNPAIPTKHRECSSQGIVCNKPTTGYVSTRTGQSGQYHKGGEKSNTTYKHSTIAAGGNKVNHSREVTRSTTHQPTVRPAHSSLQSQRDECR